MCRTKIYYITQNPKFIEKGFNLFKLFFFFLGLGAGHKPKKKQGGRRGGGVGTANGWTKKPLPATFFLNQLLASLMENGCRP